MKHTTDIAIIGGGIIGCAIGKYGEERAGFEAKGELVTREA